MYPRHNSVGQQTQSLRGHVYKVQIAAMNLRFPGSLGGEEGPEFLGGKEGQRAGSVVTALLTIIGINQLKVHNVKYLLKNNIPFFLFFYWIQRNTLGKKHAMSLVLAPFL